MKHAVLFLSLALAACNSSGDSGVKVIVGAKLQASPLVLPIEHSVIVIDGAKFRAVGPQSSTPVPKGAQMISGMGAVIESVPGGEPIEPGKPANLIMHSPDGPSQDRVMHDGEWVRTGS